MGGATERKRRRGDTSQMRVAIAMPAFHATNAAASASDDFERSIDRSLRSTRRAAATQRRPRPRTTGRAMAGRDWRRGWGRVLVGGGRDEWGSAALAAAAASARWRQHLRAKGRTGRCEDGCEALAVQRVHRVLCCKSRTCRQLQPRVGCLDQSDRPAAKRAAPCRRHWPLLLRGTPSALVQRSISVQHLQSSGRVNRHRRWRRSSLLAWGTRLVGPSDAYMWAVAARGWRRDRPPRAPFPASELA